MANSVTLTFAGDSSDLAAASKKAEKAVAGVGDSVTTASDDFKKAGKESEGFTDRVGKLGAGVGGMSTAIDDAAGTLQAFVDVQNAASNRAQAQKRALNDVAQAQEDYSQALRDGKQAAIDSDQAAVDLEQATLDQKTTLEAYNAAVAEFGANSNEAVQAQVDLKQAGVDVQQAHEDAAQATRDASQATIDATGAQLDLTEAQTAAHPPDLQKWADDLNMIAPLLTGLTGVVALVTAAQWAWNAAQLASPTTWIILAVVALVAVIVLIATKTTWFQRAWSASWKWIKSAASDTWDFLKKIPGWIGNAFSTVADAITAPFRLAFNFVADAWNATIGSLSWSVPAWIPGIGGQTIQVPQIQKFHSGGIVPGVPGSDQLAMLQAGERVVSASGGTGQSVVLEIRSDGTAMGDALTDLLSKAVRRQGGDAQRSVGGRNGRRDRAR
jgi:hypothetical protein